MSVMSDVRGELYTRINLKRALAEYVFNNFTSEETYLPYKELQKFDTDHPGGHVYVIGLAYDQGETKSRTNLVLEEVPVMVGYQRRISDHTDTALLDQLVQFMEELYDTARKDFDLDGYTWNRNESLKDENGTPYAFVGLREAGLFEAYFTAFYQHPKQ